jgi:hypothetical protein
LNPQPRDYESPALTLELQAHVLSIVPAPMPFASSGIPISRIDSEPDSYFRITPIRDNYALGNKVVEYDDTLPSHRRPTKLHESVTAGAETGISDRTERRSRKSGSPDCQRGFRDRTPHRTPMDWTSDI